MGDEAYATIAGIAEAGGSRIAGFARTSCAAKTGFRANRAEWAMSGPDDAVATSRDESAGSVFGGDMGIRVLVIGMPHNAPLGVPRARGDSKVEGPLRIRPRESPDWRTNMTANVKRLCHPGSMERYH